MTTYNYAANIKSPASIGMSPVGSISVLGNDITGLVSYTQLLVEGTGKASATGKPMGYRYFLKTIGTCKDNESGNIQDRYIYIDNIPSGNIPFISESIGGKFSSFRGLIPGMFSEMDIFNPLTITKGFTAGSMPSCRSVTLNTVDENNNNGVETHYMTDVDLENINPCVFSNKKNPVTNAGCIESYSNNHYSQLINNFTIENNIVFIFVLFAIYLFIKNRLKYKK